MLNRISISKQGYPQSQGGYQVLSGSALIKFLNKNNGNAGRNLDDAVALSRLSTTGLGLMPLWLIPVAAALYGATA